MRCCVVTLIVAIAPLIIWAATRGPHWSVRGGRDFSHHLQHDTRLRSVDHGLLNLFRCAPAAGRS
jgi:hypothetical protein